MGRAAGAMAGWVVVGLALVPSTITGQSEDPLSPSWDRFHNSTEAHALLDAWADRYPQLTELYSIGQTLQGAPLMVLEITDEQTGRADEKPAYYVDGNIHAEELTGAEVALHFAWYLLTAYGNDDRVTRLLDTRAIYVRPKFNPDGADVALTTIHNPRSTPRPYDEDRDGLLDEDPPNDLDGDGFATNMRVPNPHGLWKRSPDDPRVMVRRAEGETEGEFYDVYSEGIDDDGDGLFNEDDVGGIDMNRNFPRNWGLEYQQTGAGPYPLSEPETKATIEFLDSHRNVTGIVHGHTAGGFVYRLPSTTSWDDYGLEDQRLILELSAKYAETTGQPVRPSYSDPRVHRYGTLISWAYWDFGIVSWVPEYWGGFGSDYDGDGRVTEAEQFRWNEEETGGAGFAAWSRHEHPQLGVVEVGGWRARFTRRNPPTPLLREEIEKYVPWIIGLAEASPRVVITDVDVVRLGENAMKVTASIENEGYLPTNITQRALDAEVAVPVRAIVELSGAELVSGRHRTDLGHLAGSRDTRGSAGRMAARRSVEYVVRVTGAGPSLTLTVVSEKGGVSRREVDLGRN